MIDNPVRWGAVDTLPGQEPFLHQYGASTHVGRIRENNEDSFACDSEKELWIVADGMGGLGFGEVASAISTLTVTKMIRNGHGVNRAIEQAHVEIKAYAESEGKGTNMGTTIVLLLSQRSRYNIFWVGDSRAYLLDNNELSQITVDHSLVQSLIEQGELTEEEARKDSRKNVVSRALGVRELETVRADSVSNKWSPNQKVLLCSDGLTDCVSDADIGTILQQEGTDQELADQLIAAALKAGGNDNVTVILVSASETTRLDDSDTSVPFGSRSDDTELPTPGGAQARSNSEVVKHLDKKQSGNPGTQLDLTIPDIRADVPALVEPASKDVWVTSLFGSRLMVLTVIAVVLLLLLYVGTKTHSSTEGAAKPAPFSQKQDISAQPKPVFPPLDLPSDGSIIQVGIFSLLDGAEDKQLILADLGLEPYIQKRSTEDGLFYAVLLGPLSPEVYETTVVTLNSNNLTFFQRPSRGFRAVVGH
jgi:protein phosphatase